MSPSSSPTRNHRLQSLRSDAPLVSGRIGRARSRSETSWKLRIPNSKSPTSRNFSGFRVAAAPSMLPRRPTAGCSRGSASFFGATLGRAFLAGLTGSGRIHTFSRAGVAQSVEQGTENPRVGGSIPSPGTPPRSRLLPLSSSVRRRSIRFPAPPSTRNVAERISM